MTIVIKSLRFSALAWFAAPLCALGFLLWMNVVRIQHVREVSALGGWNEKPAIEKSSRALSSSELATSNGLIIPEHITESYHWIAQTQRMFNRGEWRVRHIEYENAPFGRTVHATSPYRWWIGAVAWCDHLISGRTAADSVERAALVADPLLHFILLLGTTAFVAWRFGVFSAALISIGFVTVFPLGAEFPPGAPDDHGMAHIFAVWSVLLLLAGVNMTDGASKSRRRWFFFAGVTGGLGLWLSVSSQVPILMGIIAGALLAAWMARTSRPTADEPTVAVLPWRIWAVSGAVTVLCAYLIEFAPANLGEWQLTAIHPLYGLAWLGGGEVLVLVAQWIQERKFPRSSRNTMALALAVIAVAILPVAIWKIHGSEFLIPDPQTLRLTKLPGGAVADSLGAWILRHGLTAPAVLTTLLPLVLIIPAIWLVARREIAGVTRVSLSIALGPVLIALGFACQQLVWWNAVDGLLLVMLVAATGNFPGVTEERYSRFAWSGLAAVLLLPGVFQVAPRGLTKDALSQSEVFGLVERDLSGWLARHAPPEGAVVLAPPNESTALCYYGNLRGIGTLSWENKEGVAAAIRILSASTAQEAKELIDQRGIAHIVILSWDTYFDAYARMGTGQMEGTFRNQLRTWELPPWLRPVPYQLPVIAGFEGQSATIYEVVEDQGEAAALGRTTEYFLEMGDPDKAASVAQGLRRFPADLGAWVARAEVEQARADDAGFSRSLKTLQTMLATKNATFLPWDQRVRLAVVLAKAKQPKLAREQVGICVAAADEMKLRALSTGSLYRLLVLSRAFDSPVDSKLSGFALDLLPSDLRSRLQ